MSSYHEEVRLTNDEDHPYYRLAVQQAEVKFGIKAVHPLFFTWSRDPEHVAAQYGEDVAIQVLG